MSKVFEKLSFAGLIHTSPCGTFVALQKNDGGSRRTCAGIISRKLQKKEDFFIAELKKQLEARNISSVLIQIDTDDKLEPDFFQHLNFDGYIFVYGIFYLISADRYEPFCISPRVVGNWLPDSSDEYCVDFDQCGGLDRIVPQLLRKGFRHIALAFDAICDDCAENYHEIWKKLTRRYKIVNYNSALDDFFYSGELVQRWAAKSTPPELVLCRRVPLQQAAADMQRCGLRAKLCHAGEGMQSYTHLADVLANVFSAVAAGEKQIARRTLIGRFSDVENCKFYNPEELIENIEDKYQPIINKNKE